MTLAGVPADAVDVILRDGRTLRLRPPRSEDAGALLDFFRSLSERSLYLRFHGFPSLGPNVVEPFLEPDWSERGALLGAFAEDGAAPALPAAAPRSRWRTSCCVRSRS